MYLVRGYFTVSILYVLFSYNCPIFLSLETFGSTFEDPNCAMVLYTDDGSNDTVAYFLIFFAVTVGINLLIMLMFSERIAIIKSRFKKKTKKIASHGPIYDIRSNSMPQIG
uniref:7TM_GPCR_Srx domain-containing protein n=1 Tax=Caenorhabditis japonica TaxID=281687 RepID=A0A8R1DQ27_CAEJA